MDPFLEKISAFWMVGGIENEGESMPRIRKSHAPSLKARVTVEAIKARKTTSQGAKASMDEAYPAHELGSSRPHKEPERCPEDSDTVPQRRETFR
jgi:hypothetical protein